MIPSAHGSALAVEVRCSACGQRNRIAVERIGSRGKCGRCKAELAAFAQPLELDRLVDLREAIARARVPVVVDFWASWCGPCRMVAPEVAKVASRRGGEWLVVKANTEHDPALGEAFGIRSIPTMAVFASGRERGRTSGARPAEAIERFVAETLRSPR